MPLLITYRSCRAKPTTPYCRYPSHTCTFCLFFLNLFATPSMKYTRILVDDTGSDIIRSYSSNTSHRPKHIVKRHNVATRRPPCPLSFLVPATLWRPRRRRHPLALNLLNSSRCEIFFVHYHLLHTLQSLYLRRIRIGEISHFFASWTTVALFRCLLT